MLLIIMLYCLLVYFTHTCIFHLANLALHPIRAVKQAISDFGFLLNPYPNTYLKSTLIT